MDIVKYFPSIHDMHNYLTDNEIQPLFAKKVSSETGSSSFCKTDSYEQADNFLLYGDKESMAKVESMGLKKTRENIARYANRRQVYSSVVGFAPNVANYVAGSPCSMIASRQVRQKQKVVKIVYVNVASGFVSSDSLLQTAANMFCAIMILEAQGIKVDLTVGVASNKARTDVGMFLKVKKAGQKLDVLRMIYPCVNPSLLRRHYFRFCEVTKGIPEQYVNSYGCPTTNRTTIKYLLATVNIKADAILTYDGTVGKSVDDILKMIRDEK